MNKFAFVHGYRDKTAELSDTDLATMAGVAAPTALVGASAVAPPIIQATGKALGRNKTLAILASISALSGYTANQLAKEHLAPKPQPKKSSFGISNPFK